MLVASSLSVWMVVRACVCVCACAAQPFGVGRRCLLSRGARREKGAGAKLAAGTAAGAAARRAPGSSAQLDLLTAAGGQEQWHSASLRARRHGGVQQHAAAAQAHQVSGRPSFHLTRYSTTGSSPSSEARTPSSFSTSKNSSLTTLSGVSGAEGASPSAAARVLVARDRGATEDCPAAAKPDRDEILLLPLLLLVAMRLCTLLQIALAEHDRGCCRLLLLLLPLSEGRCCSCCIDRAVIREKASRLCRFNKLRPNILRDKDVVYADAVAWGLKYCVRNTSRRRKKRGARAHPPSCCSLVCCAVRARRGARGVAQHQHRHPLPSPPQQHQE